MKKYSEPEIEVIAFDVEDKVSFTSGETEIPASTTGGRILQFFDDDFGWKDDFGINNDGGF